ncbi:MAG TPA: hypothetical protein PKM63_15255 [Panacibacter sp.]|nr:hypothetical protein [Panacibacter sp.]HNP45647.1 hypothetical protein [Panacibacter sp.]
MATFLFQYVMLAAVNLFHPFFVSMTDVNFNNSTKELEISVRIFTDDFENTIAKYHQGKVDILHPPDQELMNSYVNDYIQKHLQFTVNDNMVAMKFVGYEQQAESIWTYFEVDNINTVKKIKVFNNLLHDYSDKEINMLHLKANNIEQNYKLDYPKNSISFNFQ